MLTNLDIVAVDAGLRPDNCCVTRFGDEVP
jgi:hypothetical protein